MKKKDIPDWMTAQTTVDEIAKYLLGDHYFEQFDWIQNGRANSLVLLDIMNLYPKWLIKLARIIPHRH